MGCRIGFECRVRVVDRLAAVLAVDKVVDHARLQRARAEQRHQRDDVVEAVGLQAPDQVLHAARFELEHRRGLAGLQQLERRRIVQRNASMSSGFAGAPCIDGAHRPVDDGQRAQAQKVELDQPDGLDVVLVVLRNQSAAALLRSTAA